MKITIPLCALALTACATPTRSGYTTTSEEPASSSPHSSLLTGQTPAQPDDRLNWWRQARFGMFIHFGLYAIPAGEWDHGPKAGKGHAEWIRDTAQIPIPEYEQLKARFNPTKFNADAWAAAAKQAGMQYLCITTKHHDGFCLFDTKQTDWSVMQTPFKRDIMREVADACRKQNITPCWYHSIMDWHHPDYIPRRPWEQDSRPIAGADFNRYNQYLNNQVTELLTNYGPIGVMWFDGQWEGTWNHTRGQALYNLCRQLQPTVIVNNRCDRGGNLGSINGSQEPGVKPAGDYLTPEQEIPDTGLPGDWETCMTMNDHWGYNKNDHNYKSTKDLIHKLADIASKGGNFLLNVGPTPEGEFPPEALERLQEIGQWMAINGESIHGTQASPFEKPFAWGRCTQKPVNSRFQTVTRLYLHVLDWPKDGKLTVPGVFNEPHGASLLGDKSKALPVTRGGDNFDSLIIDVPMTAPDPIDTVVALDLIGLPNTARAPGFVADNDLFVDSVNVSPVHPADVLLHYTLDGSDPTMQSPFLRRQSFTADHPDGVHASSVQWPSLTIRETTILSARPYMKGSGTPVGPIARRTFTKVTPIAAITTSAATKGVRYEYFEGDWNAIPNFTAMKPVNTGIAHAFDREPPARNPNRIDRFGFRYHAYYTAPTDGVYTFHLASDDGSNLYIDGQKVINNDGLHSLEEKSGSIALAKGAHALTIDFFEKTGGHELDLAITTPATPRRPLKPDDLSTESTTPQQIR